MSRQSTLVLFMSQSYLEVAVVLTTMEGMLILFIKSQSYLEVAVVLTWKIHPNRIFQSRNPT